MKKIMLLAMLAAATVVVVTSCSKDDPLSEFGNNNQYPITNNGMPNGNGSSTTTGELATLDISLDAMSAEPASAAAEYFPDEEDQLENNEFTTEVKIDLSNPTAKTENGVEVTVNGEHVTDNHGAT